MNKDNSFLKEVEERSGQNLRHCYQCNKCFNGCTVSRYSDYGPNAILRMIQYGQREKVLKSEMIWLCVSCMKCGVRCPNQVDLAAVMDTLKAMSYEAGLAYAADKKLVVFHEEFLRSVKLWGRLHEMTFYIPLLLRTLDKLNGPDLVATIRSAVLLLSRMKLPFMPGKIPGIEEIEKLYKAGYKATEPATEKE